MDKKKLGLAAISLTAAATVFGAAAPAKAEGEVICVTGCVVERDPALQKFDAMKKVMSKIMLTPAFQKAEAFQKFDNL